MTVHQTAFVALVVAFSVVIPGEPALSEAEGESASAVVVASAFAVVSEVERGFSPASRKPPRSGLRSAEGRSEAQRT